MLLMAFAFADGMGGELNDSVAVERTATNGAHDIEAGPPLRGIELEGIRSGARMPGPEEVLRIANSERRKSGTHESFGRRSRSRTGVERTAAVDICLPAHAGAALREGGRRIG
jgi:hypothetical protein